jgi:hypothetical protein
LRDTWISSSQMNIPLGNKQNLTIPLKPEVAGGLLAKTN